MIVALVAAAFYLIPTPYFDSHAAADVRTREGYAFVSALFTFLAASVFRWWHSIRHCRRDPERKIFEEDSRFLIWAIPLPRFHFHHEPYRRESSHSNFFGREELCNKFLSVLKHSQNSSGSYLVAGYRGVGKTSFVKKVLEDYRMGRAEVNRVIHPTALSGLPRLLGVFFARLFGSIHLALLKRYHYFNNYSRSVGSAPSLVIGHLINGARLIACPFIIPSALVLSGLFLTHPSGWPTRLMCSLLPGVEDRVIAGYLAIGVFTALAVALYLYLSRGFEALNPLRWWAWLFRPVLLVQINLGHEKLDTKRLLFDIATLLHIRYRDHVGIFSLPTLAKWVISTACSLVLANLLYTATTQENEHAEQTIERQIFSVFIHHARNLPQERVDLPCVGDARTVRERLQDIEGKIFFEKENFVDAVRTRIRSCFRPEEESARDDLISLLAERAAQIEQGIGAHFSNYCETIFDDPGEADNASLAQRAYCEIGESLADFSRWVWLGTPDRVLAREACDHAADPRPQRAGIPVSLSFVGYRVGEIAPQRKFVAGVAPVDERKRDQIVSDCAAKLREPLAPPRTDQQGQPSNTGGGGAAVDASVAVQNNHDEFQILPEFAQCDGVGSEGIYKIACSHDDHLLPYQDSWSRFIAIHFLTDVAGYIPGQYPRPYHLLVFATTFGLFSAVIQLLFMFGPGRVTRQIAYIHSRIVATDTVDSGVRSETPLGRFGVRRRRTYQPLDSRQAESLILDALETNRRILFLLPKPDIIFIFDELDKINPTREMVDTSERRSTEVSAAVAVRRRKFEVEQLLANLKNLITVAPCRFIFIAGRDMMDADLADQGEVNHLYSSLFDETFYVPSFLTDASDDDGEDISSMVEQYVCRRLMPRSVALKLHYDRQQRADERGEGRRILTFVDYDCWSLSIYAEYLLRVLPDAPERAIELISFLQDFIYYLSYRSAGSPKKLALQFEQFVQPMPRDLFTGSPRHYHPHPPIGHGIRFVLRFDQREQYQIQLISHVFIMLHGETSHLVRQFGDKLSLSTFSILDYLFKFHAVAFSIRDLERMPDVLDIHRAPALPQVIDILLGKMLTPYLRRVDNGLYDYRFLHYFQPEVAYISQFSERDLAAFNFTLDESISIKQHYRDLLDAQLRYESAIHGQGGSHEPPSSLSLASLHTILGDLYSLDREFSEALNEYRNALTHLAGRLRSMDLPDANSGGSAETRMVRSRKFGTTDERKYYPITTSVNALVAYVRILLKMGLMSEQRSQYDDAISRYFQAYRAVDHVLRRKLGKRAIAPNISLLTVLIQPYVCLAFVHAKKDQTPEQSDRIMDRMIHKFTGYLKDSERIGDRFPPISPEGREMDLFRSRLLSRWAEIRIIRSRFLGAASKYIEALKGLLIDVECLKSNQPGCHDFAQPNLRAESLRAIGFNLSGLADALSAISCYRFNLLLATGRDMSDIPPPPEESYWARGTEGATNPVNRLFKRVHKHLAVLKEIESDGKLKELFGTGDPERVFTEPGPRVAALLSRIDRLGPRLYVESAVAYYLSETPSEAALSLLKLQYFLAFAYRQCLLLDVTLPAPAQRLKPSRWKWLFPRNFSDRGRTEELMTSSFEASYEVHSERLRLLYRSGEWVRDESFRRHEDALINWIAPPISQFSRVLKAYWLVKPLDAPYAEWEESVGLLNIRSMGAFPIHERIFASHLKGGMYLEKAEMSLLRRARRDELTDEPPVERIPELLCHALFHLISAAEDGSAYDGGTNLLSPHLGFIYYRMWRTLLIGKLLVTPELAGSACLPADRESFQAPFARLEPDLDGERRRFLLLRYSRDKAMKLLGDITGRHSGEHGLSNFVSRRYYLHDSFSDPYVQGLWAVDYGLVPVVRKLKEHLRENRLNLGGGLDFDGSKIESDTEAGVR
ncbi:hypothetical protein JCM17961_27470 [Endothiovibrio diazotrophicus]